MIIDPLKPSITYKEFNRLLRVLDLASLIHAGNGIQIESVGDSGLSISLLGNPTGVGDDIESTKHAKFISYTNGPFGVANTAISAQLLDTTVNVTVYARTPSRDGYINLAECSPFFEPNYPIAIRKEKHPFKEESTGNFVWISGWFCIDVLHHCCVQQ